MKGLSLLLGIVMFCAVGKASVIDFETLPDGSSSIDGYQLGIDETFSVDNVDISFGFDSNNDGIADLNAIMRRVGSNQSGFSNDRAGKSNIAASGFENQLGQFFLASPVHSDNVFPLIINYSSDDLVTAASGEIWDIDGTGGSTERFRVEAYNEDQELLDTILSPLGNSLALDAKPWTFGFSDLDGISQLKIFFTGSKTSNLGIAFNNFSPTSDLSVVPEPFEWMLIVLVLFGVLIYSRANFATQILSDR